MKLWRDQPDNWKWKPTERDVARMWIGLGAAFVVLGLYSLWFPSQSPGIRWRWLYDVFYIALGSRGEIVLDSAIGVALLFFGVRKYRASRATDVA